MTEEINLVEILLFVNDLEKFDSEPALRKDNEKIKEALEKLKARQAAVRSDLGQIKLQEEPNESAIKNIRTVLQKINDRYDKLKQLYENNVNGRSSPDRRNQSQGSDGSGFSNNDNVNNNNNNNNTDQKYEPLPFSEHVVQPKFEKPEHHLSGPPEIAEQEIIYDPEKDFIGKGSYGYVYKGTCRGKKVAIKVPKQQLPPRKLEQFRQEVAIMSTIFHPNIVLFMGACTRSERIKIVTELCVTDVEKILRSNKPLSLTERMQMSKGAALGMNWLHGINNIIHRDLKSANLLISEDGTVKVTDFGFGKFFEAGKSFRGRAKGTPLWMAPEVMLSKETNEKRDVYSFGIILWEFITREEPFQEFKDWQTFKRAVAIDGVRPKIPDTTLPSIKWLIERCWADDYKKRPTFAEIVFRLNEILVDCQVDTPPGQKFYKKHFLVGKPDLVEVMNWEDFVFAWKKELGWDKRKYAEPETNLELLKEYLCYNPNAKANVNVDDNLKKQLKTSDPEVTIKNFNQTIAWFGPFFDRDYAENILHNVYGLKQELWFHGFITKEEASERLEKRQPNTFLVRLSTTSVGKPYTISIITSNTDIAHRRVEHKDHSDKFTIRIHQVDRSFDSLLDLVRGCKPILKLGEACPTTPGRTSNYL